MGVRQRGKDRVAVSELSLAGKPRLESTRPTRGVSVDMHRDQQIGLAGVTQVDPRLKFVEILVAIRPRRIMGGGPTIAVDIPTFYVHRRVGLPGHDHPIPTLLESRLEIPCVLQHEHRLFHGWDAAIEKSRESTVLASMPGIETNDGRSLERGWECDWRLYHRFKLRRRSGELQRRHRLRRGFHRDLCGPLFNTS